MTLVSTQTIGSGDGYVETTVSQLHTARIFGFSQADVDQNYSSVEFGLHLEDSSNTIYVIESGTVRGTFGTYAVGDKMRVSIESGVVKYKKNGATFYTSTVTPNYPLLVDTALYSNGATLTGVVMASSAQNVSWTNTVGVTASGSNLTKTAAAGWGNAGAVSNQTITSGDGYVETTVGQTGNARIFGFSDSDADQNYTSVDFGLHMEDNNPNLWVYESGTSRGVVGTYAVGDKLRVTIEGGVVKYRKNGALLHTSTVTPTYPLLVDTALHTNGATLSNVVFGNGSGGSSANVKWLVNDHLGTPRMIFDQTGSLANVSRHDYLPFGEELTAGTGGRTIAQGYSASDGIRQKFTGYEADGETGLNFAQARYHSPTQGRFTSPDPMLSSGQPAEPQSWNRYGYVLNNPLVFTDPSGLIWGYQDGTNANGERVRTFQWFDGDQVDEGWSAYHSDRYVGRDEVLVLASNDFMRIARSNFSEEEYASLLQAQGADCTAFNDEQRSVINREVGKEVGRGWRFGVQKGVAGIFGAGLAGGASSALNFTFGASARQASRLPPVLFHYTDEASAGLIQGSQLGRPGGQLFLTNNGGLTPLQAQLELSLPAQNSARALFAVDSQVLNTTNLLRSGRVTGNVFGRPGGGFEFQFRSGTTVPQGSFTPFRIGP